MKKLIVIMAIFALIAGSAFADATLGGQLMIGTNLLEGDSGDDSDVTMGGIGFHEAKMHATFGDSKGGGKLVYVASNPDGTAYAQTIGPGSDNGKAINMQVWGFLWWRPVAQFRMQVGVNSDGDFGVAQISGWGFTGEAKNSVGAMNDYENWGDGNTWWMLWPFQTSARAGSAFYGGTGGDPNVNFQFFPIDGLTATFVLPINGAEELIVQDQFKDFQFNIKYNIEDIGLVSLAFQGRGGLAKDAEKAASAGDLYASFYLTALDGMKAELGLTYNLPWENDAGYQFGGYMGVGLGFSYDGGPFNFKLRANATLGGKTVEKGQQVDRTTLIYANILPSYKINGDLTIFLYTGLSVETGWANYDGSRIGWFINPYIAVRASDGLRFWAGLQVVQDGRKMDSFGASTDSPLWWRVPFGFNFYF